MYTQNSYLLTYLYVVAFRPIGPIQAPWPEYLQYWCAAERVPLTS